jgi:hypothetical protein
MKATHAPAGAGIVPISIYLYHQLAVLRAIEENDFSPERLRKIVTETDKLIKTTQEIEPQRSRP